MAPYGVEAKLLLLLRKENKIFEAYKYYRRESRVSDETIKSDDIITKRLERTIKTDDILFLPGYEGEDTFKGTANAPLSLIMEAILLESDILHEYSLLIDASDPQ